MEKKEKKRKKHERDSDDQLVYSGTLPGDDLLESSRGSGFESHVSGLSADPLPSERARPVESPHCRCLRTMTTTGAVPCPLTVATVLRGDRSIRMTVGARVQTGTLARLDSLRLLTMWQHPLCP